MHLRLLHAVNFAAVPMILAKYQRKLGYSVTVIDDSTQNRRDTTDYWSVDPNIIDAPREPNNCDGFPGFPVLRWISKHNSEFDLIHVHGMAGESRWVSRAVGGTPAVLHVHGYESVKLNSEDFYLYRKILVSTPDLWQEHTEYVPNPVDLYMWPRREHAGSRALWFKQWDNSKWEEAEQVVRREAANLGLDLTVIERWHNWTPYLRMPELYAGFDVLMEYKPGANYSANKFNEPALGLAALECLASGLRVFFLPEGRFLSGFPEQHEAASVARGLDEVYGRVLANRNT